MILVLVLGCASAASETAVDCSSAPGIDWEGWGQGFFLTFCDACHSDSSLDRHGAPTDQVFDTWAQVQDRASDIRGAVLEDESMPIGGGVSEEDLYNLDVMLSCVD